MNVLVLGSGGREHAIAWKIKQSDSLTNLFIAPGNPGTAVLGENISLDLNDFSAISELILNKGIELLVVGPEAPLVDGLTDFLKAIDAHQNLGIIGPSKVGAVLEGSKDFAKEFMQKHRIPTARYKSFSKENLEEGSQFLESLNPPYVLKADGLAAGKGVLIIEELEEAKIELRAMLEQQKFGKASDKVVIEEFLSGIEMSVFVITDGNDYRILPEAKDYKRIGEGDSGLNTGGMGAVSPVPFVDEELRTKIEERIIKPSINGLSNDGIDYCGFLFIGLMIVDNDPYVIEYNVRLGDPETEVILPRIKSDFLQLLINTSNGSLNTHEIKFEEEFATTVMLVSGGYPESYEKGKEINSLEEVENITAFHAGTKEENGILKTNGGRVIALTSMHSDMQSAIENSIQAAEKISFDGKYFRRDIGKDLMN